MAIAIRRLEESDIVEAFDCGDGPLNSYLKHHAWINQNRNSIGVTYVAIDESAPGVVLAYFTLAVSSIPRGRLPKKLVRSLPPYDVPVILLARLAVDSRFAGKGLGRALIAEAFRIMIGVSDEIGCRGIITDAYRNRINWYAQYGFISLDGSPESGPQKMFLDIRTVRAALSTEV